jgi:hypothetical protein
MESRFAASLSSFRPLVNNKNNQKGIIIKLKKYQLQYETRILRLITECELQSQQKQSNYKESEELGKHLGKLINRWKRLTSIIVECVLELNHESAIEEEEYSKISEKQRKLDQLISSNEEEIVKMNSLSSLLQHFIANNGRTDSSPEAERRNGSSSSSQAVAVIQPQQEMFLASPSSSYINSLRKQIQLQKEQKSTAFSNGHAVSNKIMTSTYPH